MADALIELEALREATRVRITQETGLELRYLADAYASGNMRERIIGHGLQVLLDMHDKLETIRNG